MADIDDIISGVRGNTRADFSGIGNLPKAYWEGKDQAAKNDLRDAFKDGLPMKGGQPDWGAISNTFFQKGAIDQGISAAGQGLAQQKMEYGQRMGESAFPTGQAPAQTTNLGPPSVNRGTPIPSGAPVRAASAPAQRASSQGDQPGSIVGLVSAAGIPDELAGPIIQQVSALAKTDPNAALNPEVSQRIQQVVQAAAQRLKGGQQPQPSGLSPQPAPPQPQMAPQQQPDFNQRFSAARPGSDPTLGGLVPAGRTAQQQIDGLTRNISSGMLSPEQAKAYQSRIDAITKAIEPTGPMKEYDKAVQQGFQGTLEDWQNRTDDNTTQRDILTKSTIPRLDKSQETATAARDDISAIHRAREELDQKAGVFSGAFGEKMKFAAKVGAYFGIPDDGKIKNTEAYGAAIGSRVASMVKAFGSGTAISDGDRRFAAAMAGGQIDLEESSMRRILDIGEKASRGKIDYHNQFVDKAVKSNEGLKPSRDSLLVNAPGNYKKPESGAASFPKFNSPSDVKAAVSSGKLKSGDPFLTSDGRTKYVP